MKHVLALDEGTTGTTALVVSADGRIVGRGYREITQHFPKPGWVEHDPNELFTATRDAAREAIAESRVAPDCIGLTNQRETVVMWDRTTSEPVGTAIVWQDRRTAARCAELAPRAADIRERTGLVVDPYFSATKIEWLLANRAPRRDANIIVGTVDSWLVWRLTNGEVHATDPTNASRTMLYDINTRAWSPELCDLFGVPRAMLPDVRASSGSFGVAAAEHFGRAIPILGVAGDQQAALFGHACVRAGEAKNTYGTGAFLLMHTGDTRPHPGEGMLATIACGLTGETAYAIEASIFIAGAAVQWLRDGLGIIESAGQTEAIAKSLASNDGVYFVPALTGLGAPHWEPNARGTIVGLTRGTGRAHFVRAALEAMAYGTADVLAAMRAESGAANAFDALRVDGGATSNDWLMQFQADVLGAPVERPDAVETTALGAGALAGVAAGIWRDARDFVAPRQFTRFMPMNATAARTAHAGWQR
ncbi:MAG TPA: glycerol kinase GlpK, partial [Gemmatimonadaceae bacterium]|nr:glycerol kinase GlpK [Gemmatimonadaceae bacterium]